MREIRRAIGGGAPRLFLLWSSFSVFFPLNSCSSSFTYSTISSPFFPSLLLVVRSSSFLLFSLFLPESQVREVLGPVATPDAIQFTSALPETRSGKIMRRILRKVAEGEGADGDHSVFGDTSTLSEPTVIYGLIEGKRPVG